MVHLSCQLDWHSRGSPWIRFQTDLTEENRLTLNMGVIVPWLGSQTEEQQKERESHLRVRAGIPLSLIPGEL